MKQALRSLLTCGLVAWPAVALACPVCFAAKNEASRIAFLTTTVFLTATPLLMIGGVIYWLARRSAERVAVEEAEGTRSIEDANSESPALHSA